MTYCRLALLLVFAVLLPGCEKTVGRYRTGMSMSEAKVLMQKEYTVRVAATKELGGPLQFLRNRNEEKYMIEVEDERVVLFFNSNEKLIRVDVVKAP